MTRLRESRFLPGWLAACFGYYMALYHEWLVGVDTMDDEYHAKQMGSPRAEAAFLKKREAMSEAETSRCCAQSGCTASLSRGRSYEPGGYGSRKWDVLAAGGYCHLHYIKGTPPKRRCARHGCSQLVTEGYCTICTQDRQPYRPVDLSMIKPGGATPIGGLIDTADCDKCRWF